MVIYKGIKKPRLLAADSQEQGQEKIPISQLFREERILGGLYMELMIFDFLCYYYILAYFKDFR